VIETCRRLWFDLGVPDLESLSRGELEELARRQDAQIVELTATVRAQDAQITRLSAQLAGLMAKFEQQSQELAKLQHLVSRNSANSSMPSSKDDDPGRTPPYKERRAKPSGRAKGKQKGAPGNALRWREALEVTRLDQFPEGVCPCGADLADAVDLGVVDRYRQHEVPLVSVTVTQYDQHAAACSCGKVHTAKRPEGAGAGQAEYGPNLRAFAVYLLVVHFVPVHRVREILESLTGARPSVGFVHSLLVRAARLLTVCDFAIRTLITLCFACARTRPR
jgi:uncharacterized coiled-coil protein SlyX/transposase